MDLVQLTSFFGWMLVINTALYVLSAAFVILGGDWTIRLEARITGVPEQEWPRLLMDYLSRYKLAVLMFNLVPYLALLLVA